MPRVGETAHIRSDLGQDHLGETPLDPGDRLQPPKLMLRRAQPLVDLQTHVPDSFIKCINVSELFRKEKTVVRLEISLEGLRQQIAFRAHAASGKLGQESGISFTGEQGREQVTR